jgi:hypothetical protein
VPAAAVIPAPIAYMYVVAVKTLVVETLIMTMGCLSEYILIVVIIILTYVGVRTCIFGIVTLRKLECFKQA